MARTCTRRARSGTPAAGRTSSTGHSPAPGRRTGYGPPSGRHAPGSRRRRSPVRVTWASSRRRRCRRRPTAGEYAAMARLRDVRAAGPSGLRGAARHPRRRRHLAPLLPSAFRDDLGRGGVPAARAAAARDPSLRRGARVWLGELAWRDFFAHLLDAFPRLRDASRSAGSASDGAPTTPASAAGRRARPAFRSSTRGCASWRRPASCTTARAW